MLSIETQMQDDESRPQLVMKSTAGWDGGPLRHLRAARRRQTRINPSLIAFSDVARMLNKRKPVRGRRNMKTIAMMAVAATIAFSAASFTATPGAAKPAKVEPIKPPEHSERYCLSYEAGTDCGFYRSTIASFAALICGAMIFLRISRGSQFHQLAIGTMMSAITQGLALGLFELCWRAGVFLARPFGSENRNWAQDCAARSRAGGSFQSQQLPTSVRRNTMPIAVMPMTAAVVGKRISMDALTLLRRPCRMSKSPAIHVLNGRPTLLARSAA